MTGMRVDVAIIGAGPGGLTLAHGLIGAGIDVAVFERDEVRADYVQGFRLRVRRRGLDALRACLPPDLHAIFEATAGRAPSRSLRLTDQLAPLPEIAPDPTAEPDDTEIERSVSRITLRQVLLSGLDGRVHFGAAFTSYIENADGTVTARFADGRRVDCQVLIGADGAGSQVRRQLLPDATSVDTGARRLAGKLYLADAARIELLPAFVDYNVHVVPPGGRSMMITSHHVDPTAFRQHGRIGGNDPTHRGIIGTHFDNTASYVWWNTAYWRGELGSDDLLAAADGRQLLDLLAAHIGDWHPEVLKLIRHSDPSTVACLRVRSSVPVPPWPTRRVTLLGDAIHAMTYFRALGANSAIHDAGLLAAALRSAWRGERPLIEALGHYEQAMLAHGTEAVTSSRSAMERAIGPPRQAAA